MRTKILLIAGLLLVALALTLAACGQKETAASTPCPTAAPCADCPTCPDAPACPECPEIPEPVVKDVPFQEKWAGSPHADATAEAFRHWDGDDPIEVPTSCAKCHSAYGFQDFVGADGTEAGVVDNAAAVDSVISCAACHNDATKDLSSVVMPSGVELTGLGAEAICMTCHQGRASKASVDDAITKLALADDDTISADLGFVNIHYFAAAVTLYGKEAAGGYEYAGKLYDAKHDHVEGYDSCVGCHDTHSLEVKVEQCANCHAGVASVEDLKNVREVSSMMDYDGDSDTTEGMYYEIEGLQALLMTAIQAYAQEVTGKAIVFSPTVYPYFILDANANGTVDDGEGKFDAWTGRLLKAAYNYLTSIKDPGAFAHGNKYIVELVYDSIEDLNTKLAAPVDLSTAHRDDAGHFAGNTMPFRDWDDTGMVPGRCAKCHSAGGMPQFLAEGVNTSMPSSNGFACVTCHDGAEFPNRLTVDSVVFPSGASVTFGEGSDSNLCIVCHQGRSSTVTVDTLVKGKEADIVDAVLTSQNIHYFPSGATLFGGEAQGFYQYADKEYLGKNAHPVTECTACHDVHELEVKLDTCKACHGEFEDVSNIRFATDTTDWDGDGDVTEGVAGEIATLGEKLYAAIQAYAETTSGVPIVFSRGNFYVDADKDGKADVNDTGSTIRYNAFTPRLLEAAYNYNYLYREPATFVHNPKYVMQGLYDSITDLGGDVTGLTRP